VERFQVQLARSCALPRRGSLAAGISLPPLRGPRKPLPCDPTARAVSQLPLPGIGDGGHRLPRHPGPTSHLVPRHLLSRSSQERHLSPAVPERHRGRQLPDGLDAAAQAASGLAAGPTQRLKGAVEADETYIGGAIRFAVIPRATTAVLTAFVGDAIERSRPRSSPMPGVRTQRWVGSASIIARTRAVMDTRPFIRCRGRTRSSGI